MTNSQTENAEILPLKMFAKLEDAIAIAAQAHKGQVDKAGGEYIMHPLRMMMRMETEDSKIAAVLHDVVEDSKPEDKWTIGRLAGVGFSNEVLEAVACLTKADGEPYEDFIDRAASNPIALQVKIADLEDNMNLLRLNHIRPKDLERLEKYHRSWKTLKQLSDKIIPEKRSGDLNKYA